VACRMSMGGRGVLAVTDKTKWNGSNAINSGKVGPKNDDMGNVRNSNMVVVAVVVWRRRGGERFACTGHH